MPVSFNFAFVIKVFAALFAIMNPIANIPVFLSLTDGASREAQQKVALTAIIGVAVGCAVSAVAGEAILGFFGISVDDFRLAGGVIVLLIALSMLQGTASHAHARTPDEKEQTEDIDPTSVAIYPLTVPLLVGPGTIATLIIFAASARKDGTVLELAVGLVAFLALLAAALLAAPFLGQHLSQNATAIARRLMGMILAAIAMEMIVTSLRTLLPGLAR